MVTPGWRPLSRASVLANPSCSSWQCKACGEETTSSMAMDFSPNSHHPSYSKFYRVKRRQALLSCFFLFSFLFFFISCPNQCIVSCSADSPNVPAARLGCLLQLPRRESERAADVNSADPTTSTLQASAPGRESGAVRTQTDPMLISAALMIISRAASALLSYRTRWKRGLPLGFVWGFVCLLVFPLSLCY